MNNNQLLQQLLQLTVWLPIKGYDNYEVSICGMVRNVNTKKILRPSICKNGYYCVNLYQKSIRKLHKIHRLVAKHFIPNLNNNNCVDHIDNNKINNTFSNLRWCDASENQHNRQLNKNNSSGAKGIIFYKRNNKWKVYIKLNNKTIHLGYFVNFDDAKQMRQLKAKELFGEFINACEK